MVLTKTDLVPYLQFAPEQAIENARSVNPELAVFWTSSYTGEGLEDWIAWLSDQVRLGRGSGKGGGA